MVEQNLIRGRWLKLTSAALLCALTGCNGARKAQTATLPASIANMDDAARAYLKLAFSLGQRDLDSQDYYYGPKDLVADAAINPPALNAIKHDADTLLEQVRTVSLAQPEQKARQTFLMGQLEAISGRVSTLNGSTHTFDEETEHSFGVVVPASADRTNGWTPEIKATQAKLNALLPGKGSLAERYQSFDNKFIIPPARVEAVIERAIQACKTETAAHVTLPAGEKITLQYVGNKPWSGYSWYKGNYESLVQINLDYAMTVDRALQLACHEGYPGHHVYNSLREAKMVRGKGLIEYEAQPTYSPQSLISESMATIAVDVAFPREKRVALERDVLLPLAGIDARQTALYLEVEDLVDQLHPVEPVVARDYIDGKLEFERAAAQLESGALMLHPEPALKYMNEYRSYVATYTYGRDLVTEWMAKNAQPGDDGSRWKAYEQLMMLDAGALDAQGHAAKGSATVHTGG